MNDVPPPPPPPPPGSGGASPDVGAALSYGFNKFFANVGPMLAVIFIPFLAQVGLSIIGNLVVKGFFGAIVFNILGFLIGMIFYYAIFHMALMITAGEPADIGKAFENDRWGEWFVFAIVYGLIISVGFALCFLPGLFAIAVLGLAPYYFIDQRMSLGDALSASWQTTTSRGYALPVFLSVLVGGLGFILCLVGGLVTLPAAYIAVAFLYRGAQNQPVAP